MRQIIIIFIGVFLLIWGLGLLFSFLSGISKLAPPLQKSPISGTAVQKDQRRLADEAEEMNRKAMQDLQFQMQHYKDTRMTDFPKR